MDLIAFLRAQLDEDERMLTGSGDLAWLTYRLPNGDMLYTEIAARAGDGPWIGGGVERVGYASVQIVYRESERLAEVAAKRAVLDWIVSMHPYDGLGGLLAGEARRILQVLAQPYAGRPGWDETWRTTCRSVQRPAPTA